jgi:methyl-accepting chemotaxis protein
VLLIHMLVLTNIFAAVANEVASLREENSRVVRECARLIAENNQLAQDHAQLREQSSKMMEELKARNLKLTSKYWLSWSCCVSSICRHMIPP